VSGFLAGTLVGAAIATAAFAARPLSARGADGQTAATQSSAKIVFENARVRVKDATFAPGVTPMHTHDLPHVGVVIQGGTLIFKDPTGKLETMKLEPGGAGYRDANVSHEPTNPGKTPVRVIEVELK
jgi:mannose-6-phosphate isomerase-like protein (cupin superfamily)